MLHLVQVQFEDILDIRELQKMAEKQVGIPKPLEYTDRTVALVEYRRWYGIDAIKELKIAWRMRMCLKHILLFWQKFCIDQNLFYYKHSIHLNGCTYTIFIFE